MSIQLCSMSTEFLMFMSLIKTLHTLIQGSILLAILIWSKTKSIRMKQTCPTLAINMVEKPATAEKTEWKKRTFSKKDAKKDRFLAFFCSIFRIFSFPTIISIDALVENQYLRHFVWWRLVQRALYIYFSKIFVLFAASFFKLNFIAVFVY